MHPFSVTSMAARTKTCVAAVVCIMHIALAARAISPDDARKKHLMMLDPRMPARLQQLPRSQLELQQQQRLQQQVQRYATKQPSRSTAKQRHMRSKNSVTFERSSKSLARNLLAGHQMVLPKSLSHTARPLPMYRPVCPLQVAITWSSK